jgi:hypothetical protein
MTSQTTSSEALFTRAEVQRGLPEKRASLLLFLIECKVMEHVARLQSIVALSGALPEMAVWPTFFALDEVAGQSTDVDLRDPIGALKLARQGRGHPTIWEIERYAAEWRAGVPPTPQLRAATARLLAQKYHFTAAMAVGIRRNLGLDTVEVQTAFAALYSAPLTTIYAPQVTLADRLHELGARVANALVFVGRTLRGGRP